MLFRSGGKRRYDNAITGSGSARRVTCRARPHGGPCAEHGYRDDFVPGDQSGSADQGDFERDRAAAETARDTITRALIVNLTTVPIATSSSGFLYRLNPQLGTVERATDSFGGFFIERALTPGNGRASFGISGTSSSFDQLDGQELRTGAFLTTADRFTDEPAPFDTDSLTLRIGRAR